MMDIITSWFDEHAWFATALATLVVSVAVPFIICWKNVYVCLHRIGI